MLGSRVTFSSYCLPQVISPPPSTTADLEEISVYCVPWVEACALVTLCSYRCMTRRLSLVLLKEVRSLHEALSAERNRVSVFSFLASAFPPLYLFPRLRRHQ